MTPERQKQVSDLFAAALNCDLSQRESFLRETCDSDSELRAEVEELLALLAQVDSSAATKSAAGSVPLGGRQDSDGAMKPNGSGGESLTFGRYRLIRPLGAGGFGKVFLAHDDELNRAVAIKLPRRERVSSAEDVEAYLAEARILAQMDHPNIVPVHDLGRTEDGLCFVVSKYVEGSDLASQMKRGRFTFFEAARLIGDIAQAAHHAHTRGLVHRDIKPANILVDCDGKPSLTDFGLALKDEDFGRGARFAGTPTYMSPEQARGEGHRVDGRSDIFSLGVILYELLTGRRPFRGDTHDEIMEQICYVEPRPPRQIDDTISKELERICLKALAKRASERYTTARDLAEDLRLHLASEEGTVILDAAVAHGWSQASPNHLQENRSLTPTSGATDSDQRPMTIVPKGLRAFDEHDADFFLELLPGPRDREGLPESIRFWKTRVEERSIAKTFRVGLIYGPSGCGKSSLVRAGLLPRLRGDVINLYIEATQHETEARLERALCQVCPRLQADRDLADAMAEIRRGKLMPAGRKLLLVIDQFEQWLQSGWSERDTRMVRALRQCDGEHVQAVVLVRDDFWMAATRFMTDLEIRLVEGENSAAVDLFEPPHARSVLAHFGRAYGILPAASRDVKAEQHAFLDQSVTGLAQDGKIIPVRLALFAQMVRGKPWTPASLRLAGGIRGVGAAFLEETFTSPAATPEHRLHEKAARAVLKALLPGEGTDIKGKMRSEQELLEAAGYTNRPAAFEVLLHILDTELRLITPTDPEGSFTLDPTRRPGPDRYYQLTHDYLVHSLEDWLTRKQRETRKGRAELLLADRASFWMARPENRHLPTPWEWATIGLFTRRKDWNEAQRLMMKRAGTRHGLRALLLSTVLGCAIVSGLTAWHASTGAALVPRLLSAEISSVPQIVKEIRDYRRWTDTRLYGTLNESPSDPNRKLRASLALLEGDPEQLGYLASRLQTAAPAELPVLRDALWPYRTTLAPVLWQTLETKQSGDAELLPAASALARYAPSDSRWERAGDKVAVTLASANPVFLGTWIEALKPVSQRLIQPLARIFRDQRRPDLDRSHVANILADYAAEDHGLLASLALDAAPREFATLFTLAARQPSIAISVWISEIRKTQSSGNAGAAVAPGVESEKDRLAERQARAAVGLIRLGEARNVWPLLAHSPDPRLRSLILNWLNPLGAQAESVVAEFLRLDARPRPVQPVEPRPLGEVLFDAETSLRRSLILALGSYGRDQIPPAVRDTLLSRLLTLYRTDPDPGIHGAVAWTLRQSGADERLAESLAALRGKGLVGRWFVNSQSQTFVVLGDRLVFAMGSPEGEHGRRPQELLHTRSIQRRFAIAAHEVTVAQFQSFLDSTGQGKRHTADGRSPDPTCPANSLTWYEAAEYCNWLSRVEGLSEVYEPNQEGQYAEGMRIRADALKRNGYRLPTEAEWEYACRAGAGTSRYYGNSPSLLRRYAWFVDYGEELLKPCGSLMPNDLGMFDMLGNTYEWCMGRAINWAPDRNNRLSDAIDETETVLDSNSRVIRGGSFADRPEESRSAYRDRESPQNRYMTYGFRIARTFP